MAKEISAKNRIAIIGGGHIGCALAEGLIRSGLRAESIMVSNPKVSGDSILKKLDVCITRDNNEAVHSARWVFLAVKPSVVPTVLEKVGESMRGKVLISLAAGVSIATLQRFADKVHFGRIMPNMPIAVGAGVVGLFAANLSRKEKSELTRILSGLGIIVPVASEQDLDALTLISSCGPGIVAFLISTLTNSAKTLGVSTKDANRVAQQTFKGTVAYLTHTGISPEELVRSVATKGGVTEAILTDFAKRGLAKNFTQAIAAGLSRVKKLDK